jgi:hypothetical protein
MKMTLHLSSKISEGKIVTVYQGEIVAVLEGTISAPEAVTAAQIAKFAWNAEQYLNAVGDMRAHITLEDVPDAAV